MTRPTVRLLPHGSGNASHLSGKYKPVPGSFIDVLADSSEYNQLSANGWLKVAQVGTTAQRPDGGVPASLQSPFLYLDTTAAKIVAWDGVNWRDPATGAVA